MIANGADVRLKNQHEATSMHLAAAKGHNKVVQLLHQADYKEFI